MNPREAAIHKHTYRETLVNFLPLTSPSHHEGTVTSVALFIDNKVIYFFFFFVPVSLLCEFCTSAKLGLHS